MYFNAVPLYFLVVVKEYFNKKINGDHHFVNLHSSKSLRSDIRIVSPFCSEIRAFLRKSVSFLNSLTSSERKARIEATNPLTCG